MVRFQDCVGHIGTRLGVCKALLAVLTRRLTSEPCPTPRGGGPGEVSTQQKSDAFTLVREYITAARAFIEERTERFTPEMTDAEVRAPEATRGIS